LPLHDQIQTYAMVRKFDIPVNPSNTPYFKLFKHDATIHSIWSTVQKELIYLPLHDQIQTYAMVRKFDIPVNPSNTPYFKLFK
ncbi:hypothetical protein CQA09_29305, partial [Klebsiella pneumoniae]